MKLNMLYKCKLMEWLDVYCEPRHTCRIQDRIQDQVFMKTEALQSPPGTAVSIKNSDENRMVRKWRNSIIRQSDPAGDFSSDTYLGLCLSSGQGVMGP